jgi:hypothetical protein
MSHTPGPWRVFGALGKGTLVIADEASEKGVPRALIAVVYGPAVNPESEANSRLIAALPELVHAAKLAATENLRDFSMHHVIRGIAQQALEKAGVR